MNRTLLSPLPDTPFVVVELGSIETGAAVGEDTFISGELTPHSERLDAERETCDPDGECNGESSKTRVLEELHTRVASGTCDQRSSGCQHSRRGAGSLPPPACAAGTWKAC